jgi:hypothetical protein
MTPLVRALPFRHRRADRQRHGSIARRCSGRIGTSLTRTPDADGAERTGVRIVLLDERGVDLRHVGVHRDEIAGRFFDTNRPRPGSVSERSRSAGPIPQMIPPVIWLRAVFALRIFPAL